jgi:hypothetical protein
MTTFISETVRYRDQEVRYPPKDPEPLRRICAKGGAGSPGGQESCSSTRGLEASFILGLWGAMEGS